MNTDLDWIRWGQQDPYFAVITDPRYRASAMSDESRQQFFDTGRWHARYVLDACRRHVDPAFAPRRVLDFGCGVGRVALPLAELVDNVVGLDVAPAMLAEADRNAKSMGRGNVLWRLSDETLTAADGSFDLVHSCITLQHIDVPRGRRLLGRLLALLSPGGAGAIQITYAKERYAENFGQPPENSPAAAPPPTATPAIGVDPGMQMNSYHLGEVAFLLQSAGVTQFHASFTDHGGELGVFLFFGKPATA